MSQHEIESAIGWYESCDDKKCKCSLADA